MRRRYSGRVSTPAYVRRLVDDQLDELLPHLPAIALDGPKAVGKTRTAQQRSASVLRLDQPVERELLAADPGRLERLPTPLLLDEWQRLPEVWDLVRRSVDSDPTGGRFLLTGSAVPPTTPAHSGAGRIVSLRMRPLSLVERQLASPTVSLAELLAGDARIGGDSGLSLPEYVHEILASGFPGLRGLPGVAREAALDGYLDSVVQRDFPEQGLVVRRPHSLRAWLTAYAAATATTASYNQILAAATPGESNKPARGTVTSYRDVLAQLWLLEPLPSWVPVGSSLAALGKSPAHHLADPALAARLLGATSGSLLSTGEASSAVRVTPAGGPLLGRLFESLVVLSLRTYAQRHGATLSHLRTADGGHEIDLVVEGRDGGVVALEVKLAATVTDSDVRHLLWLRDKLGPRLRAAAVVTTGPHAYRRRDGIVVIPAALLGP
jgi:predicted AAA+ superfamily ATPase